MATRIRVGQINFNETVNVNNQRITNLATPQNGSDAATKQYVDNIAAGLKWKNSVKVATTGNITLSGTQQIDGVSVNEGDRVLVWKQTDATENGIYVVSSSNWVRAEDADSGSELVSAACFVEQGNTYADKGFVCTNDSITIGVTEITFVVFTTTGGLAAGNGIEIIGNTISVKPAASGGIQVDSDGVAIKVKTNGGLGTDSDGAYVVPSFVKNTIREDLYIESTTISVDDVTIISLTYKPFYSSSNNNDVIVTLNGLVMRQGEDYSVNVNDRQIVFSYGLKQGDYIVVYYTKDE
ncbi:MAG: hypothetical protein ABIM30_00490 [candidate division WOR-3 bacterium]